MVPVLSMFLTCSHPFPGALAPSDLSFRQLRGCQLTVLLFYSFRPPEDVERPKVVLHQENAESDWKCLEALPVLTVAPKRIEVHGIMTEYIFSHRFALLALDSDEAGAIRAWNKQ